MDNFNFELLRTFLVVCKLKSFSRASDYLYVDQSTISKEIRQLEEKVWADSFCQNGPRGRTNGSRELFQTARPAINCGL